jgi:hypothetical protein
MLEIDDSVRELYPGAKMGILAVIDASYSSSGSIDYEWALCYY